MGIRSLTAFVLSGSMILIACAAAPADENTGPEGEGDVQSTSEALSLTKADAVSRAELWATAKLKYCQSANGARDYDSACSTYCSRQKNAQWDPYRSDCSGLVSWAWGLASPGRITTQFAPFQKDITSVIQAKDLAEGDAVNNSDHIMLFKKWITKPTKALFIEEPGCSSALPYAHETTSTVTVNGTSIHVAENGMTFTAIRYGALKADPVAKPAAPDAAAPRQPTEDTSGDPSAAASPEPATPAAAPPASDPTGDSTLDAPPAAEAGGCSQTGSSPASTGGDIALALAGVILLATRRRRVTSTA